MSHPGRLTRTLESVVQGGSFLTNPPTTMIINFSTIALFIIFLANLFIGVFVIYKGLNKKINILFGVFVLQVAIWNLVNMFSFSLINPSLVLLFSRLSIFSVLYIPFSFLYFVCYFLSKPLSKKGILTILFPAFIMNLFIFSSYNVIGFHEEIRGENFIPGPLYLFYTIYFFFIIGIAIYFLIKFYYSSEDLLRRYQIKYILFGMLFSSTIGIFTDAILPLLSIGTQFPAVGNMASIVLTICVGYAITRYNLLDIQFTIKKRLLSYFIIILNALLIGTILILCLYYLDNYYQEFFIISISIIGAQFLYIFLTNKITVDTYFFYGAKKLDFSKNTDKILIQFQKDIKRLLSQSYSDLRHDILVLEHDLGCFMALNSSFQINLSTDSKIIEFFRNSKKVILNDQEYFDSLSIVKSNINFIKKFMNQHNIFAIGPLYTANDIYGLIILYNEEDTEDKYNKRALIKVLENICRNYGPLLEQILVHNAMLSSNMNSKTISKCPENNK